MIEIKIALTVTQNVAQTCDYFESRVDHGMTHCLYIQDPNGYEVELLYELPRQVWEEDIGGALNYSKQLPTEGSEALDDETTNISVFRKPTL